MISNSLQKNQKPGVDYTKELLYDDAICLIFEKLSLEDLVRCGEVCVRWNVLHTHNYLWRPFLARKFGPAPCVDSVCRDVYQRCMSMDGWEKKQDIVATHEKVKAFVRDGFTIIYQTNTERVRKWDLYSEEEVLRIPHQQFVAKMEIVEGQLYVAGGSNAITMQSAKTLDKKSVIGKHNAWIYGFDCTDEWIVAYSTNGIISIRDYVNSAKEQKVQLPSKDIDNALCFENHIVISYITTPKLTIYDISKKTQSDIEIPEMESIATMTRFQEKILLARLNGKVELWDSQYNMQEKSIETGQMISTLDVTKNSVVIGGLDGTVSVWRLPDFRSQGSFKASNHKIIQIKRTADEITALDKEGRLATFQLVCSSPMTQIASETSFRTD